MKEIRTKEYVYNTKISDIQDVSRHQAGVKEMIIISSKSIKKFKISGEHKNSLQPTEYAQITNHGDYNMYKILYYTLSTVLNVYQLNVIVSIQVKKSSDLKRQDILSQPAHDQ